MFNRPKIIIKCPDKINMFEKFNVGLIIISENKIKIKEIRLDFQIFRMKKLVISTIQEGCSSFQEKDYLHEENKLLSEKISFKGTLSFQESFNVPLIKNVEDITCRIVCEVKSNIFNSKKHEKIITKLTSNRKIIE